VSPEIRKGLEKSKRWLSERKEGAAFLAWRSRRACQPDIDDALHGATPGELSVLRQCARYGVLGRPRRLSAERGAALLTPVNMPPGDGVILVLRVLSPVASTGRRAQGAKSSLGNSSQRDSA
jgi:hypothetical protein